MWCIYIFSCLGSHLYFYEGDYMLTNKAKNDIGKQNLTVLQWCGSFPGSKGGLFLKIYNSCWCSIHRQTTQLVLISLFQYLKQCPTEDRCSTNNQKLHFFQLQQVTMPIITIKENSGEMKITIKNSSQS